MFGLNSDDGSKLLIKGTTVVVDDGRHGPRLRTGTIKLPAGSHTIQVEYFNGGGGAWLEVFYSLGRGRRFRLSRLRPLGRV